MVVLSCMSVAMDAIKPLASAVTADTCKSSDYGVSVVIPAYNYAHFLPEAIDSALNQTHKNVEIIVVDDGSTDTTPEVAARYGDKIRYIRKKNAGLPAARNTGIQHATQPFIGFLDADDIWHPDFLSKCLAAFDAHPHEFGLVAGQATYVDEKGVPFKLKDLRWSFQGKMDHRDILLKTRFSPSAVVARKQALEAAGLFDESLRSSEDRDMWIRVGAKYPIYLLDEQLVSIRRHRTSMSRNAARMKSNIIRVLEKSSEAGLVDKAERFFWLKAYSFMHFQVAWMFYEQGDRWTAIKELLLSGLYWPWFGNPQALNEPALFRLRTCRHFLFLKP